MKPSDFRPADTSAAAIHVALTKAQEAQQDLKKIISDNKTKRDSLLLDGDAKQLATAEQALRESRDAVERLDAIVAELTARHAAAERREAEQKVTDAIAAHAKADAALAKWWRETGPQIRDLVLEGHRHSKDASDAATEYHWRKTMLEQRFPDVEVPSLTADGVSNAWERQHTLRRWVEGEVEDGDIK